MNKVRYNNYSVEKDLVPLFENSGEWFEHVTEQYEMACGKFGKISSLSPETVTFRAWGKDPVDSSWHLEMEEFFSTTGFANKTVAGNSAPSEVTVLKAGEQSQEFTTPITWAHFDGRSIYMYERVPFNRPVTTQKELQSELARIMHTNTDFLDDIFAEAESVASEDMNLG